MALAKSFNLTWIQSRNSSLSKVSISFATTFWITEAWGIKLSGVEGGDISQDLAEEVVNGYKYPKYPLTLITCNKMTFMKYLLKCDKQFAKFDFV